MAATSVNNLVESFKNPTIPPIDGKTTYATIHALHELLNLNEVSVNTNIGCGTLRHLCLALSPTVYTTLSATRVVTPRNPVATPFILAGATGPKAESI